MNNYIPTKKSLYISLGAAIIGALIFIGTIVFLVRSISSIERENLEAEAINVGLEGTFLIKKDLTDYRTEIELLDSFFVSPGGEVAFIEKLEGVARSSKVQIEIHSISVPKTESDSGLVENLSMKVRFEGEWKNVENFLKAIEDMPFVVSVGSVEANLLGGSLWKGEVEVSVLKIKGN